MFLQSTPFSRNLSYLCITFYGSLNEIEVMKLRGALLKFALDYFKFVNGNFNMRRVKYINEQLLHKYFIWFHK